jgi:hypothetical protein
MVSSCSARVAVPADQCLGGQFLCAAMYYGGFVVMVNLSFCCSTYDENIRAQFLIFLSLILS